MHLHRSKGTHSLPSCPQLAFDGVTALMAVALLIEARIMFADCERFSPMFFVVGDASGGLRVHRSGHRIFRVTRRCLPAGVSCYSARPSARLRARNCSFWVREPDDAGARGHPSRLDLRARPPAVRARAPSVRSSSGPGLRPAYLDTSVREDRPALVHCARSSSRSRSRCTPPFGWGSRSSRRVREYNPKAKAGFFGLYAPLNGDELVGLGADFVLGGECEPLRRRDGRGALARRRIALVARIANAPRSKPSGAARFSAAFATVASRRCLGMRSSSTIDRLAAVSPGRLPRAVWRAARRSRRGEPRVPSPAAGIARFRPPTPGGSSSCPRRSCSKTSPSRSRTAPPT